MLIKLSDTQWIDSRFIRRLFLQQFNDNNETVYKIAADMCDKTVYGLTFKDFHAAVEYLNVWAQAVSEASRHET